MTSLSAETWQDIRRGTVVVVSSNPTVAAGVVGALLTEATRHGDSVACGSFIVGTCASKQFRAFKGALRAACTDPVVATSLRRVYGSAHVAYLTLVQAFRSCACSLNTTACLYCRRRCAVVFFREEDSVNDYDTRKLVSERSHYAHALIVVVPSWNALVRTFTRQACPFVSAVVATADCLPWPPLYATWRRLVRDYDIGMLPPAPRWPPCAVLLRVLRRGVDDDVWQTMWYRPARHDAWSDELHATASDADRAIVVTLLLIFFCAAGGRTGRVLPIELLFHMLSMALESRMPALLPLHGSGCDDVDLNAAVSILDSPMDTEPLDSIGSVVADDDGSE